MQPPSRPRRRARAIDSCHDAGVGVGRKSPRAASVSEPTPGSPRRIGRGRRRLAGTANRRYHRRALHRLQIVVKSLDPPADCIHNVVMRVIAMSGLREFWDAGHAGAESPLRDWYRTATKAAWQSLEDIRRVYPYADAVKVASGRSVVVFNIGGNKYRLIVDVLYAVQVAYVCKVLTHAEYSKDRWKQEL